jgi:hypothetical protein
LRYEPCSRKGKEVSIEKGCCMGQAYKSSRSISAIFMIAVLMSARVNADTSKIVVDQNSVYGIFLLQTPNSTIKPTDSLKTILEQRNVSNEVKDAVVKSLGDSMMGLAPLFSPGVQSSEDFNLQTQGMKAASVFVENLKKNLAGISIKERQQYQLLIAPRATDKAIAVAQKLPGVTYLYPSDRSMIVEMMPDAEDAYPQASSMMNTMVYKGIVNQMIKIFEDRKTDQPHFLMLTMDIVLDVDQSKSSVRSEIIATMPVNIEKDFVNENEQIKFSKIVFPEFKPASQNGENLFSANTYPVVFVNMIHGLRSPDVQMTLQFGPLGTYSDGKWTRIPGKDFTKYVPKLRGTPKAKGAMNALAGKAFAEFNIFNIEANLLTQEVSNIDLFISVGLRRYPNLKFGSINSASIDSQFQAEINKTIEQEVSKIKENLQDPKDEMSVAQQIIQTFLDKKK